MNNPKIRKELLGRDNEWIAERIASVEQTNTELLEALEYALDVLLKQPNADEIACNPLQEAIRKATA